MATKTKSYLESSNGCKANIQKRHGEMLVVYFSGDLERWPLNEFDELVAFVKIEGEKAIAEIEAEKAAEEAADPA